MHCQSKCRVPDCWQQCDLPKGHSGPHRHALYKEPFGDHEWTSRHTSSSMQT